MSSCETSNSEFATAGLHLAIAAGGTGGHFYPALAVAKSFASAGGRVTVLISGHQCTRHLEAARAAGFEAVAAPAVRLPRRSAPALVGFAARLLLYRHRARVILRRTAPDVLLAMGSYACVPAALAALAEGVPLVLHEANAVVGRANRFLSRWAKCLATSLPLVPGQAIRCPQVHTGLPLRSELLAVASSTEGTCSGDWRQRNGLQPELPLLLVFGGSQGAKALNGAVPEAVARMPEGCRDFQVLHLCGAGAERRVRASYETAKASVVIKEHETEMGQAYRAADLAVCRAGAGTVCELALFGVPSVLIPLPTAADDHQTANARILAKRGSAFLLPESENLKRELPRLLIEWRQSASTWRLRAAPQPDLAPPDAAARIVRVLLNNACRKAN
ncbi:MAG: UDP-N-acetylglucosamine--N-acetylmuramyl-(pentapeptide) pyrophosphoryl-undecaprenol N-acetylglucosamine transferase [Kiritimatiellaeota bacterium]|nr:UDP-N-acetylglucosamine--N-acetylmuramyl-(pentapeptide) pyrophosphoryl-undecaprenol N-acetylglucosamine transferase [Kiritimatiellota bacterium]